MRDEQVSSAGLGHPDHLAQRDRLVWHEHDPELRPGEIEAVVVEFKSVGVHDVILRLGAPLLMNAGLEPCDHRGRPVRRHHLGAKARGRQTQAARSGGDVEELFAGLEASEGAGSLALIPAARRVGSQTACVPGRRRRPGVAEERPAKPKVDVPSRYSYPSSLRGAPLRD